MYYNASRYYTDNVICLFHLLLCFLSAFGKDDSLINKIAIQDYSTQETRTFGDYHDRMNRIAAALVGEYNLKPNETVALYSPNNVDYLPICLAVGICGAKVGTMCKHIAMLLDFHLIKCWYRLLPSIHYLQHLSFARFSYLAIRRY